MRVVGTSIRDDQVEAIDQIASDHQVNRSIVIRWAIDAYLKSFFLAGSKLQFTNEMSGEQPQNNPAPELTAA